MSEAGILLVVGAIMSAGAGVLTAVGTRNPPLGGAVTLGLIAIMLFLQMATKMK